MQENNSIFTGYTIKDWQSIASEIMLNTFSHFSEGRALVRFAGARPSRSGIYSDMVEGFARNFLLTGFWMKNRKDGLMENPKSDSGKIDWAEIYAKGMINGTNPNHPEYWGEIYEKHQYMVEAASMAIGLFFTKHLIWNNLNKHEQEQIGDWFRMILRLPFEDKNWILFNVIINSFLKSVEQEYYQDQIDFYLKRYDSYYEAEGWYRDGYGPQFDYYNPWALHFYPHLWSEIDPDIKSPDLVEKFEYRSKIFLEKFKYLFSSTASHPAFGRSIIYRCAVIAAPIMGTLKGFSPLTPGETRRLASQSIKYFYERNFFAKDGSIPLGWTGEFLPIAEKYSGPASPLWLNKAFAALLIPSDHPFWNDPEEKLPVEKADYTVSIKTPGFLLNGHKDSGHVQLVNQGSDSSVNGPTDWKTPASDYHYFKFSYSSHFFHDIGPTEDGLICGNMISLYEEKRGFSHRDRVYPLYADDKVVASFHYPYSEMYGVKRDCKIETIILFKNDHQIRVHWVISPNLPQVFEGGYTLAFDDIEPEIEKGDNWISVKSQKGQSLIRNLYGYEEVLASKAIGKNAQGRFSILPVLKTKNPVVAEKIFCSEIIARPLAFDVENELQLVSNVVVKERNITIDFNDNTSVTLKVGSLEENEQKVVWINK